MVLLERFLLNLVVEHSIEGDFIYRHLGQRLMLVLVIEVVTSVGCVSGGNGLYYGEGGGSHRLLKVVTCFVVGQDLAYFIFGLVVGIAMNQVTSEIKISSKVNDFIRGSNRKGLGHPVYFPVLDF